MIGAALLAWIAIAADRTSLAAPANALIASLTTADGDRSSVETAREPDERTKVVVRGDFYDGRRFVKAILAGLSGNDPTGSMFDINLDIKVAALAGFNGEALHNVELKLSGQGGELLAFALTAKLENDADIRAELRDDGHGRRTIHLESDHAGAFFRFIDVYAICNRDGCRGSWTSRRRITLHNEGSSISVVSLSLVTSS